MFEEALQIIDFIKANRKRLLAKFDGVKLKEGAYELVVARLDAIPHPYFCHQLETRLFFEEIYRGGLEWLYQEKIDDTKIGDIARKALGPRLTAEELNELEEFHNTKLNSELTSPEQKEDLKKSFWMLSYIRKIDFLKDRD
jgi:hypothetical protein